MEFGLTKSITIREISEAEIIWIKVKVNPHISVTSKDPKSLFYYEWSIEMADSKIYKMKITTYTVMSQIYILPYIKVTYDRFLNGNYELIVGWINKEIVISI